MPKKTKLMPNPARQEVLMSSLFLKNLPEIKDPKAMPSAVNKKRYPPAYSERCKDSIARGIILSWVKAPIKRK